MCLGYIMWNSQIITKDIMLGKEGNSIPTEAGSLPVWLGVPNLSFIS